MALSNQRRLSNYRNASNPRIDKVTIGNRPHAFAVDRSCSNDHCASNPRANKEPYGSAIAHSALGSRQSALQGKSARRCSDAQPAALSVNPVATHPKSTSSSWLGRLTAKLFG